MKKTTVGCDGKIKIYDMSDSTPLLLKIIEGVVASSESEYVPPFSRDVKVGTDE